MQLVKFVCIAKLRSFYLIYQQHFLSYESQSNSGKAT